MTHMKNLLERSHHLPERTFAAGETVVREGAPSGGLWILVSGALQVRKGGELVNAVNRPGAILVPDHNNEHLFPTANRHADAGKHPGALQQQKQDSASNVSVPNSPIVACGPARARVRSTTSSPARGPGTPTD